MSEINSYMTDIRLALTLNPIADPDGVVHMAASAMDRHGLYRGTDCERHVAGALAHPRPYRVLKPAIELHAKMTGVI